VKRRQGILEEGRGRRWVYAGVCVDVCGCRIIEEEEERKAKKKEVDRGGRMDGVWAFCSFCCLLKKRIEVEGGGVLLFHHFRGDGEREGGKEERGFRCCREGGRIHEREEVVVVRLDDE